MSQAKSGDTVLVHYTGTLEDGSEFDSSVGHEPLRFMIGEGMLLPMFEQAVVGMNTGESKTVKIPAEHAYGPYSKELVAAVERGQIPSHIQPKVGLELQIDEADGWSTMVKVTEVTDEFVWIDANHPLAGKDLVFNIQLVEIAAA